MLNIFSKSSSRFCDGVDRRNFLKIGGLALGGASLPQILQAENKPGSKKSHKAIIMIFLPGGPPHQDMFDIKVDAPSEIRGEFKPIKTNVPGIEICEHMPLLAKMMDKFVPIRSMVGAEGRHDAFQCQTGKRTVNQPQGGWPSLGSALSKLHGQVNKGIPPFVGLAPRTGHVEWSDPGQPGFLGAAHAPFKPSAEGKADMVLNGITLERLQDRKALLTSFDSFRRQADNKGIMDGLDAFNKQAFGVLTSSKLADALDISKENEKTRERYGKGNPKLVADGAPRIVEQFLMARRLVEAGVRCVTLAFSRWDWHGGNFKRGREDLPMLDKAVTALVSDLHERGMDKDVSVVVWGEFGRTPKVNKNGGRDHWPQVSCALLAGGGLKTGQVIGSTNRLGERAENRPVTFPEVFATLYHAVGINTHQNLVNDLTGRPRFLVDSKVSPMPELI